VRSRNRREFLKGCCAVGAAGVASQVVDFGMFTAHAATADYKALVCIFLFGGNDANNMIVPIDSRYAAYQTMRGVLALPATGAGAVLPAGSSGFGLHPALTNTARLFQEQRAAPVFNVGTLARPTTKATLNAGEGHAFHQHPDQEELVYVLDGLVEQWIGEERRILVAGDSAFMPAGTVHASFTAGDRPSRLLAIFGPCIGDGYTTVELAGEAPWKDMRTRQAA